MSFIKANSSINSFLFEIACHYPGNKQGKMGTLSHKGRNLSKTLIQLKPFFGVLAGRICLFSYRNRINGRIDRRICHRRIIELQFFRFSKGIFQLNTVRC